MEKQINENLSSLRMIDFYFSKIDFEQKKENMGSIKFDVKFDINQLEIGEAKDRKKIEIITTLSEPMDRIRIVVNAVGIFEVQDSNDELPYERKEALLNKNSVAIMLPFIRSEIAIISAQPGLTSILLPVVDVNKLINK